MKINNKNYSSNKKIGFHNISEVDVSIGRKIKLFRRAKKISQSALSKKLNISYQQIQKYETGKNKLSVVKLLEVSSALGVHFSYFLDEIAEEGVGGNEDCNVFIKAADVLADTRNLLSTFAMLNKESDRRIVIDLISLLLSRQGD